MVFEIWCSQGFWDAMAHSWTDTPKYSMPRAPFFTVDGGMNRKSRKQQEPTRCHGSPFTQTTAELQNHAHRTSVLGLLFSLKAFA